MPQNTHLEAASSDAKRMPEPVRALRNPELIHAKAAELARTLMWLPDVTSSNTFADRTKAVARKLRPIFAALDRPAPKSPTSDDFTWLYDNGRLMYSELQSMFSALKSAKKLPHVRDTKGATVPRVLAIAEGFLEASSSEFSEQEFTLFVEVFQKTTPLTLRELWSLMPALRLALLEQIAERGQRVVSNPSDNSTGLSTAIRSLRDVGHTTWKDVLEPLMAIDHVLRQDPADAYARMDFDSRDLYRNRIADIAEYSDYSEVDTARKAVALAADASRRSYEDPRIALRESHVGYYLVDKGVHLLHERVRYRPPFFPKVRALVRNHPDEFFLTGIALLALIIVSTAVIILTESNNSPALVLF
jgi:cyclic beta-1,2-glucan synthetase